MRIRLLALLVCCSLGAVVTADEHNVPPDGFVALFNGKDLAGWHGMRHFNPYKLEEMDAAERDKLLAEDARSAREHWRVEDGELVNDGHGAYLTTDGEYGDFELLIDYKTVAKADSGIYLRATPQVQIWDTTEEGGKWGIGADRGSGGLWNNSPGAPGKDPLVLADRPFGEWNSFRIVMVGSRTTVILNDHVVVDGAVLENYWDRSKPLRRRGPIQLQTHGGEIRWRNIFLREIGPEEANRFLQARDDHGFESIFDGVSFRGWKEPGKPAGVVSNYMIRDGALMCRPRRGSTLHTAEIYGDFAARFEFRLPRGGNNGLSIRYPGFGDTAYVGMCELQILDTPRYANDGLDPRQAHGSAYAMAAAAQGYLREPGEWNFEEVTVVGSRIRVELNGSVILDRDLGALGDGDFMYERSKHLGLGRRMGHFGFAGHGSPVAFRGVRIKRLD